jgi:hypothetical protein
VSNLIGLTGYKLSGKDETAKVLAEFGYVRVALADPLRAIATELGWDGSKEDKPCCPYCGMLRGRRLLQVLGTEGVRRHIRDDAWLLAAERELEKHPRAVISDLRFLSEAEFVRARGGQIWRIVRPGYEGDSHISEREQAQISVDLTLNNSGSLQDLAAAVHSAMGALVQEPI